MQSSSFILPKSYRNFALLFFLVAVAVLASVLYLIWARVTIIITPNQQVNSYDLVFDITENSGEALVSGSNAVTGKIMQADITDTQIFQATGQETLSAESGVVGKVTIVNKYSKDQVLIATTRLANDSDPNKVMVRLKNQVTVPAGGEVEALVYTDDPINFKAISPQHFIIPGLWKPLQDKIYAESNSVLDLSGKMVSVVTQQDIQNASKSIKDKLYQEATNQINGSLQPPQTLWPKLVGAQDESIVFDAKQGDQAAEFSGSMHLLANVVAFDEDQVINLAREKLKIQNAGLSDVDVKSFSYQLESVDLENKIATVQLNFEAGLSQDLSGSEFFDKSKLYGKTRQEVEAYFSQFPAVNSIEIKFYPSWLQKIPRIANKITIEIAK